MMSYRIQKKLLTLSSATLLCGAMAFAQGGAPLESSKSNLIDKKFAQKAIQGGMAEVKLGQLASQNGGSEDVKKFGQKMVRDHTKLNQQMQPIIQQMGRKVPTKVSAKDQTLITKLQGESGKQFDDIYIKAMVKDHQKDLKQFQKEADGGKFPALKQAASQSMPMLQQHLQLAEQLAQAHHLKAGEKNKGAGENGMGSGAQ